MRFNSPKIVVTTILAALITVALAWGAVAAPPWSDAPAAWWVSSYGVTEAKVATVADGYPDGTFKPSLAVTRGQFAKMAVSGLGVATVNPAVPTFKDVGRGGTFYTYVEGAYAAGLIGGIRRAVAVFISAPPTPSPVSRRTVSWRATCRSSRSTLPAPYTVT